MARPSKKQLLQKYQARVKNAERWRRDDEHLDATWARMIDLYRGRHFPDEYMTKDMIVVNMAKATVDVIVPSVIITHPKVTVTPNNDQMLLPAAIAEQVVNYEWQHNNFKKPVAVAVKDSLIIGIGWVKVGWRYREGQAPLSAEEQAQEYEQMDAQANMVAQQNPAIADKLPTPQELQDAVPTQQTVVLEDRPFVERVSPFDIQVDPNATCMDDVAWIAQRIVRPLEEAKKDELYKPSARAKLQADGVFATDRDKDSSPRQGQDIELCTVWEFYDVKKNWLCVFSCDSEEFLVDPQPMPYAFGHPFEPLFNYQVPDKFYSMGDLEAIEPLQLELDKTRSQMMAARKKMGRKYVYRESAFGPEGIGLLSSDRDNVMVPIIEDTIEIGQAIQPLPQSQLDPQAYEYSQTIEQDMDRVSGISEYMRGVTPDTVQTATAVSQMASAADARAQLKLAEVEDFISRVSRKLVMLNQQFLEGDKVIRVVGPEGQVGWLQYNKDDITGEFDFVVEAGSTQPKNDQVRSQQAMTLLTSMMPLLGTVIEPASFAAYIMREMGVKRPEQFLIPMGGMAYMQSQQPQQAQEGQAGAEAQQPNAGPPSVTPPSTSQGTPIDPQVMAMLQSNPGNAGMSQMQGTAA
jgi:hypothetical protein